MAQAPSPQTRLHTDLPGRAPLPGWPLEPGTGTGERSQAPPVPHTCTHTLAYSGALVHIGVHSHLGKAAWKVNGSSPAAGLPLAPPSHTHTRAHAGPCSPTCCCCPWSGRCSVSIGASSCPSVPGSALTPTMPAATTPESTSSRTCPSFHRAPPSSSSSISTASGRDCGGGGSSGSSPPGECVTIAPHGGTSTAMY